MATRAYYNGSATICTYAMYDLNSQSNQIFTGNWVCGGSGVFYGTVATGLPRYFHNGDKLCAKWYNISGYPCEYIQG